MSPAERLVMLALLGIAAAGPGFADEPARRLEATAVIDDSQGRRQMPVTIDVNRFTVLQEAAQLATVLETGGQGALKASLAGRSDGRLMLGALQLEIALVVAEARDDGFRYVFLTPRRIRVEETTFGSESLDYPFGIAVIETDRFGRGEGRLHVAAALRIDGDGHVEVEDFDGVDGRLVNVRELR